MPYVRWPGSIIGRDLDPGQVPVEDLRGDRRGGGPFLKRAPDRAGQVATSAEPAIVEQPNILAGHRMSDREGDTVAISNAMDTLIDSSGVRLVVLGGEGEPLRRPAYLIRPGDEPKGPRMLGVWLKFCPSDDRPEESPPAEVAALIDRLRDQ